MASITRSFGQTVVTEYYDRDGKPVAAADSYYYNVGERNKKGFFYDSVRSYYTKTRTIKSLQICDAFGNPIGNFKSFYPDGIIQIAGRYERKNFKIFQTSPDSTELSIEQYNDSAGVAQVKNHNGFIHGLLDGYRVSGKIDNGLRDSVWTRYDDGGNILFHESWHEGELVDGISFDRSGKEYYYKTILALPEPVDGTQDFYGLMGDEIVYPKEAEKRGIEGRVIVSFFVEKGGQITSPKIIKGLGFGTDEEVLRIIATRKPWKPALLRGQTIRREVTLPFLFRLK